MGAQADINGAGGKHTPRRQHGSDERKLQFRFDDIGIDHVQFYYRWLRIERIRAASSKTTRLIAAAPTMLDALRNSEAVIANLIGMYGDSGAGLILREVQTAISKATAA